MSEQKRQRLDEALVLRGFAPSRSRARDMIKRATVSIDGKVEPKPARMVEMGQAIAVSDPGARYVSRGALKLIAGLDAFGFDPAGLVALDLGASTGGFSQVLLERGAAYVVAIDVGHGEMDATLAADSRVTLIEGLNARELQRTHLGGRKIAAVVADLSFISLKLALPPVLALAEAGAWGVFLVKPQFEVGPKAIGKGGVVRDPDVARAAAEGIAAWIEASSREDAPRVTSPLRGGRNSAQPREARWREFREGVSARPEAPSRSFPSASRPENFDLPSRGRLQAADSITATGRWKVVGLTPSPIAGGSGNREFLLGARKPGAANG